MKPEEFTFQITVSEEPHLKKDGFPPDTYALESLGSLLQDAFSYRAERLMEHMANVKVPTTPLEIATRKAHKRDFEFAKKVLNGGLKRISA